MDTLESKIPSPENTPSPSQSPEQPVQSQEVPDPVQANVEATDQVDSGQASPNTLKSSIEAQTNLGQITSSEQLGIPNLTINIDELTRQEDQMKNAVEGNRIDNARELMELVQNAYFR